MFVGGLDPFIGQSDLFKFFRKFGKILEVKIVGEAKGRSRGFGFVHFASDKVRSKVCGLKGLEIKGREIDCKVANSDLEKPPIEEKEDPNKPSKIFIENIPLFLKKRHIQDHYRRFGRIKDVLLIARPNKDKAFSYVKFFDYKNAAKAVENPQEIEPGLFLKAVLALPKNSERLQEMHRKKSKHNNTKHEFQKDNNELDVIFFSGIFGKSGIFSFFPIFFRFFSTPKIN